MQTSNKSPIEIPFLRPWDAWCNSVFRHYFPGKPCWSSAEKIQLLTAALGGSETERQVAVKLFYRFYMEDGSAACLLSLPDIGTTFANAMIKEPAESTVKTMLCVIQRSQTSTIEIVRAVVEIGCTQKRSIDVRVAAIETLASLSSDLVGGFLDQVVACLFGDSEKLTVSICNLLQRLGNEASSAARSLVTLAAETESTTCRTAALLALCATEPHDEMIAHIKTLQCSDRIVNGLRELGETGRDLRKRITDPVLKPNKARKTGGKRGKPSNPGIKTRNEVIRKAVKDGEDVNELARTYRLAVESVKKIGRSGPSKKVGAN